jgi:sugar-specific transcriptional regulator TrmB
MTSTLIENLIAFNLTRQEATIYVEFLNHGEMSGYEVAKETGISRSNVYSALQSLAEKGALYLIEGESTKYTPVPVEDFLKNTLGELQKKADLIVKNAPKKKEVQDGYITILGSKNIENKIRLMLESTQERIYVMADKGILSCFGKELRALIGAEKKVVVLSDFEADSLEESFLAGATFHKTETEKNQVRLIVDSSFVLTGEFSGSQHDTCLYSGQQNLVNLMKEALKNKIELLRR